MSTPMRPFALEPGGGEDVRNPLGGRLVFKVRGVESGGDLMILENVTPPYAGPPLHLHEDQDEWLYVLRGFMRFRIRDEVIPAPAGSFAFIPRGVPHTWQNAADEPASLLAGISPAGLERFFERYAALPEEELNLDAFASLAPAVRMTVVGPPLARSHPRRAAASG